VNESKIEDWTGNGVSDIKQKLLRTPIKPADTWRADPHRMLRLVRFATKLGYTIHAETDAALRRPEVLKMISEVSRERFVAELDKIVHSKTAVDGFKILLDYNMQKYILDADAKVGDVWTPLKVEKTKKFIEEGYRYVLSSWRFPSGFWF
jgi:tRNA nucleotidyltransferase/poly(A) polymerase